MLNFVFELKRTYRRLMRIVLCYPRAPFRNTCPPQVSVRGAERDLRLGRGVVGCRARFLYWELIRKEGGEGSGWVPWEAAHSNLSFAEPDFGSRCVLGEWVFGGSGPPLKSEA